MSKAPDRSSPERRVGALQQQIRELEERARELDARNLELENAVAQRGVKLSCANIALARAKLAFDESSRGRQQLVQDVAHDLRTPLTSIKGASQNLLDGMAGALEDDAREYVEIIGEHAERLIGVVNWLVDAMSLSVDPVEVSSSEIDIGELTADVCRSLKPLARGAGLCLSVATQQAPAFIDQNRIRQVLENLLGNAIKFSKPGGELDVSVTLDGDDALVRVRDTGIGMDEAQLGRIFDRYYRSQSREGGSGLGLVICREVVRLHGGEISATSEPGVGSEFLVRLPRAGDAIRASISAGSS